jgi:nucleoside-diphosphate-sugar epimerase
MHLITGTSSGLGKFLLTHLDAIPFQRGEDSTHFAKAPLPFDSIIHCAFNTKNDVNSSTLQHYVNDNLLLTQQLLAIPHRKFIFVSSSDVYPRDQHRWQETEEFLVEKVQGLYGLSKLLSEQLVKLKSHNYLILRPTALLGHTARPNSLIKILQQLSEKISLHEKSSFNYILHQDVLAFIQHAIANDTQGIFNLAANDNITLGEVSQHFNKPMQFGQYLYQSATLCNQKTLAICKNFHHSSLANVERFLKE